MPDIGFARSDRGGQDGDDFQFVPFLNHEARITGVKPFCGRIGLDKRTICRQRSGPVFHFIQKIAERPLRRSVLRLQFGIFLKVRQRLVLGTVAKRQLVQGIETPRRFAA